MKVFITGQMRSGTTLISNLLNSNEEISIYRDFIHIQRIKESVGVKSLKKSLRKEQQKEAKERHNGLAKKIPTEDKRFFIQRWTYENLADYYESFLEDLRQKNERIVGHKTTQAWDVMGDILYLFPELKIIYMVRDPRDIAVSSARKWPHGGRGQPGTVCRWWREGVQEALRCRRHTEGRVFLLKFEDLLTNTDKTLDDLSTFLESEVAIPEEMTEYGQVWRGNSSFENREQLLDPSPVGRWKERRPWIGKEVEARIGPLMREMGYKVPKLIERKVWIRATLQRIPEWIYEKVVGVKVWGRRRGLGKRLRRVIGIFSD